MLLSTRLGLEFGKVWVSAKFDLYTVISYTLTILKKFIYTETQVLIKRHFSKISLIIYNDTRNRLMICIIFS